MTATKATAPSRAPSRRGVDATGAPASPARERRHLQSVPAVGEAPGRTGPKVHIVIGFGVGSLFAVLFAVAVLLSLIHI